MKTARQRHSSMPMYSSIQSSRSPVAASARHERLDSDWAQGQGRLVLAVPNAQRPNPGCGRWENFETQPRGGMLLARMVVEPKGVCSRTFRHQKSELVVSCSSPTPGPPYRVPGCPRGFPLQSSSKWLPALPGAKTSKSKSAE